jgi:HEAT repeats
MRAMLTNRRTWLTLILVAGLAGVAYWQREPALAWYYVRQLSLAYPDTCEVHAKKVAELDEAALPRVLSELQNEDAIVCANMQYALMLMMKRWGVGDSRSPALIERLQAQFADFSLAGQEKVVVLLIGFLQQDGTKPLPPRLTKSVSEILIAAEKTKGLRAVALLLVAELMDCVPAGQWVDDCRAMAERGLIDERPGARIAAVQLLLRESMRADKELVEKAIPLLRDADAAVRRAAIVSLASETEIVREEYFLPLLHDDDAQVQYVSELALRKRGLLDDDIKMARLISHPKASVRLRVLHYFPHMPELNLASWLRQLSNDPEPAVRAAAVRASADYPHVDFSQRLREMVETDPAESVRENARYYLSRRSSFSAGAVPGER